MAKEWNKGKRAKDWDREPDILLDDIYEGDATDEPIKSRFSTPEEREERRNARTAMMDQVDHPAHYQTDGRRECIEEMRLMFGDEAVMAHCRCCIWKYMYRGGKKNGEPEEKDKMKAAWYMNYLEKLKREQKK